MALAEIINPESVLCNAHARSKKHCLEILSELLVRPTPEIPADAVFEKLVERERLGCTGLRMGVAFPHCRIEGLEQSCAAMIRLSEPIDFDSADGEPIDLVIGLVVPSELDEEHYADVKTITCILGDDELRSDLRGASTSNELYETLLAGCSSLKSEDPPQDPIAAQGS
ncbi:MAG: PTS sugar transporter subunit IIA [Woeseiaceae bacterium]|nr:PTS sugar transporter subunit IIA [Woeseiaceae bacterium]